MENANKSVYPSENLLDSGHPMLGAVKVKTSGINKREYFAGLAMQGILANPNGGMKQGGGRAFSPDNVSELALKHADALLAELKKSKSE